MKINNPPTVLLDGNSYVIISIKKSNPCPPSNLHWHWLVLVRASVDALCRDETGQISCDPPTKSLLTRRERLASFRNAPAVAHGFISSCTYVERPRAYLQFSTREFAHMLFLDYLVILHLLQNTRYLQAGINLCADFGGEKLQYCQESSYN